MTAHRNAATFARLADPLGFVAKDDIFHALKAILAAQRDYGRRDDRKFSRLKYLIADWGIDKFRAVVEQYFGKRIEPFRCAAFLIWLQALGRCYMYWICRAAKLTSAHLRKDVVRNFLARGSRWCLFGGCAVQCHARDTI